MFLPAALLIHGPKSKIWKSTATETDFIIGELVGPSAVLSESSALSTTFMSEADAHVNVNYPTTNYGTATELMVDGDPIKRAYLSFNVSGLTEGVTRATLKLYANNGVSTGITAKQVADNTWGELTIIYNNAPPVGTAITSTGAIAAGTWVLLDVTSYVTGNGTYSLALTSTNTAQPSLSLASREAAANGPRLVVETETAPPAVETTAIDYTYDPLYRLTGASATGSHTATWSYAYDAVGNRTVQTQTITSTLVTNYTYDVANRLTTVNGVTYSWDDNGNLLNDGAKTYGYNQANRLKQVVQGAITTTFAYNGAGDRLQQTVNGTPTRYALDPGAGLTQVLADGTNTYLYGNARIGQYQTAMQYFGADALGSVRQIYDGSGQVVASSRYDPYGGVLSHSGAATSVFGFTGEQFDATGLEYL